MANTKGNSMANSKGKDQRRAQVGGDASAARPRWWAGPRDIAGRAM